LTPKRKKKVQVLEQQEPEELIGSADYIANRDIDQIIKKGRDRIKHAITVSDEKLTKTKKEIIKEMGEDLEKAGYPVNQICDRLSKSLKGLVSERTVRDALESKYKDQSQSQVAAAQNHDGGSLYRQQEQLRKKDIKEFTEEDIKVANQTQLRKVAKHQMQRADWWEQQAKQNEAKGQTQTASSSTSSSPTTNQDDDNKEKIIEAVPTKQDEDKDKIIADLKKENETLKRQVKQAQDIFSGLVNTGMADQYLGHTGMTVRQLAEKWGPIKTKTTKKSKPKRKGMIESMLGAYKRAHPDEQLPEGLG
jgi:hypothetical protein